MALLEPKSPPNELIEQEMECPQPVNTKALIANQILQQAGLGDLTKPKNAVTDEMEEMGWRLREDLEHLRDLKRYSDNDSIRLQAVRTALELRRVLGSGAEQDQSKNITFVIQGGQFQLNSILNPER